MGSIPLDFLRLAFWILVVLAITAGMLVLTHLLGPRRPDPTKSSPYECGFPPFHDARKRLSVRFYTIAMIFLIFDVEVALIYPWAVVHRDMGTLGFVEILIFLVILFAGYIYVILRRAVEVER